MAKRKTKALQSVPVSRVRQNFRKSSYTDLMYWQMADIVIAIHNEIKRRNPIGVNAYTHYLKQAAGALEEISLGEIGNFTSEEGPTEEPRPLDNRPFKKQNALR